MHIIQLKPAAILMAKDVYDWYEEQKVGLGELFLSELSRCYSKLEKIRFTIRKLKSTFVIWF